MPMMLSGNVLRADCSILASGLRRLPEVFNNISKKWRPPREREEKFDLKTTKDYYRDFPAMIRASFPLYIKNAGKQVDAVLSILIDEGGYWLLAEFESILSLVIGAGHTCHTKTECNLFCSRLGTLYIAEVPMSSECAPCFRPGFLAVSKKAKKTSLILYCTPVFWGANLIYWMKMESFRIAASIRL